jgi:hypothetical protein
MFRNSPTFDYNENNMAMDPYVDDTDLESRLWENDSSYLVAVSPHVYENNRIRLKLILGYRIQSMVHGLPSLNESGDPFSSYTGSQRLMPSQRRNYGRYRDGLLDRVDEMTPEQFDRLPEHQQRRILREKYLRKKFQENSNLGENLGDQVPRNQGTLQSLAYWTVQNFDRLGWKSFMGIFVFFAGLYQTTNRR